MTTGEKLAALKARTGRNWGNIAEILGVSRQMLDFVRRGERNLSAKVEEKLDGLLSEIHTKPTTGTAPPDQTHARTPSPEDAALLQRLYDLAKESQPAHQAGYAVKDTATMAVPGLLLNFADLVRVLDADTATLARLATLLYLVHVGITSDRSQIDIAKALLDKLAGE